LRSHFYENGTLVRGPAGVSHVFFSPYDDHFGANPDPNNDYAVVLTPATPPLLQGTNEHVALLTGVNGTPTTQPDIKTAAAFSTLNAEIRQRFGVSTGQTYVLVADVFATAGDPPVGPFPDLHMGAGAQLMQIGAVTSGPAQWSLFVPPGVSGFTLILQAGYLGNSRNGLFQSSDAHRIQLQ
jgi:hypothetical protein